MRRSDSEWVNDHFHDVARDCTPDLAGFRGRILYAPTSRCAETSRRCTAILSDIEREQAEKFVTQEFRDHFKLRRAFRRYCGALALGCGRSLSSINFHTTEKGRPYLRELASCWFSFSSCRLGFLGAWSSSHAIGVDIEDPTRTVEAPELALRFFARAEAAAVSGASVAVRAQTFFRLWTLKEAALKSIGEGLPFGLHTFEFDLAPSLRIVDAPEYYGGAKRFHARLIEGTSGCAAVAVRVRS